MDSEGGVIRRPGNTALSRHPGVLPQAADRLDVIVHFLQGGVFGDDGRSHDERAVSARPLDLPLDLAR